MKNKLTVKKMKAIRLQIQRDQRKKGVAKEKRLTQKKLAELMGVSLSLVRDVEAPSSPTRPSGVYCHQFKMALVEIGYDDLLPEALFKPLPEEEEEHYAAIGTFDELEEGLPEVKNSLVELIQGADKNLIIPLSTMIATFLHHYKASNSSKSVHRFNKAIQQHIEKFYAYRH